MKLRIALAVVALAVVGFAAGAAAGDSHQCHGTNPWCASTTSSTTQPTTTTIPTTQSSTTAATTTTTGAPTFASETAYTKTRPAFTTLRTVSVSSAAALKSAITNLRAGDYVKASAPFAVTSGSTNALVIANRLSAPAVVDLAGVKVAYTGTGKFFSVWIRNVQNVRIYGGDVYMTQPTIGGGSCVGWTGSQHSLWWGFDLHDCGSGGMGIFTASSQYSYAGPTSYNDIEGTIHHFSLNHGLFDPHTEKCSGIHGANLSDNNWYAFDHNRIALNVYDSPCTGGGIEFGSSKSPTTSPAGPLPDANTIILQCANLTFVSKTQTGGNCIQFWGYGVTHLDLKYVNGTNLTGHNVWSGGLYSKPNSKLATDTIEYARASNTDQNPLYANHCTNNREGNLVFLDALPAPCYKPFSS